MDHTSRTDGPSHLGPYQLTRRLNRGAVADVYLAMRPGLSVFSRYLAVKLLRLEPTEAPDVTAAFVSSGRLLKSLDHANLVRVFDTSAAGEQPYIAMEYVSGRNLRALIEEVDGPLDIPVALHIADRLCDALNHIHTASGPTGKPLGLVHGAVNPRHVLVDFSGNVKLCAISGATGASNGHGAFDRWIDESGYRPPELAGEGTAGRGGDIYGVGVLLLEMTCGRPDPCAEIPDRTGQLATILRKATAADPGQRYRTIAELQGDLLRFHQRGMVVGASRLSALMKSHFPAAEPHREPMPSITPSTTADEQEIAPAADEQDEATDDQNGDTTLVRSMESAPLLESGPAPPRERQHVEDAGYRKKAWAKLEQQLMSEIAAAPRSSKLPILVLLLVLAAAGLATVFLLHHHETRPPGSGTAVTGGPAAPDAARATRPQDAGAAPHVPAPGDLVVATPDAAQRPATGRDTGPRLGRLRMIVTPPVTVQLGARELGRTPFLVDAPAGTHHLLLQNRELGIRFRRGVRILPGDLTVVRWTLGQGTLRIKAASPVSVKVDAVPRGQAPVELSLYEGPHRVQLTDSAGNTVTRRILIRPGQTTRIDHPGLP